MGIQKILIVDDNRVLVSIMEWMLESEGYEIQAAWDGRLGYQTYLLFRPDLVITDIQMPDMNGLDLVSHVRRHDPEVKTIYMSADLARFSPLLLEERSRHGAGLLEKPFSKPQLLRLISEVQLENEAYAVHQE